MVNILSASQLTQRLIEYFKTAQPALDTKPGEVARDLFIDGPAIRMAELYGEISRVSTSQSISKSYGEDLDNLGSNYAIPKQSPGKSSGTAILTFNSLFSDIVIGDGSFIYSRNGLAFRVINSTIINAANESQYKALASTVRSDLDFIGITDQYAVQVVVECSSTGTQGNIAKYSLSSTSIPGISNVTNLAPFTGGSSVENDASYKNRVLSIFSGSNTGTSLGFENLIKANQSVLDSVIITPGDPLMTRDGSIQETDENGNLVLDDNGDPIIISEGTGGKVDGFVYGRRLVENLDSYIYNDKSGRNDPTDSSNDFTLGQISGDENKTIMKRRYQNVKAGTLPSQPVENVLEIIGSSSGTFSPQIIDVYGNSTGNYVLQKDTGSYSGSVWGFDKIHWVSNYISTLEDISRSTYNGQDGLGYTDCDYISELNRVVLVSNENSTVSSTNRSEIQLNHTPIRSITKVLNATTGERYVVSNRNPSGNSGDLNTTGKIIISGKNLPAVSDTLQVDYEWDFAHDIYADFYSFNINDNPRTAIDVVDWGYGNAIRRENSYVTDGYIITTTHKISSVISANKVTTENAVVSINTNGIGLCINGLSKNVTNVVSIKKTATNGEVYNTNIKDGTFETNRIILPSDTSAIAGDTVVVVYNAIDLFTVSGLTGNFKDNTIYLNTNAYSLINLYDLVEVNYIADVNEILPSTNLTNLPITKYNNNFIATGIVGVLGYQPYTHSYTSNIPTSNLRRTSSKLALNVSGISAPGVLTVRGTTSKLIKNVVINCVNSGLKQDLSLAIKKGLGLDLYSELPSNIKVVRLTSLENVETATSTDDTIINILTNYDIIGYSIKDNWFNFDETVKDTTLSSTEISLPTTTTNTSNYPIIGDKLRISFYITYDNDYENVSFSTNGTLYTDKSFVYVNSISISSGFKTGALTPGAISINVMNQPTAGNRYRVRYNYLAPKNGERISIRYNNNALIGDLTLSLENERPITCDFVVKSTSSILVDVSATVLVMSEYKDSKVLVGQNVADKIAATINNLGLGKSLHPSDLIPVAYQVPGVDSILITRFNKGNVEGNVSVVNSLRNEYIQANNINVSVQ